MKYIKKEVIFHDTDRDDARKSVTSELVQLMERYDRKRDPFNIDISKVIEDINEKRMAIIKKPNDYEKFINGNLFSRAFIESLDYDIQPFTLPEFTNTNNPSAVRDYMQIIKDKKYLTAQTYRRLYVQECAIHDIDSVLCDTIIEYTDKYLRSRYTNRTELIEWLKVQSVRIDLLNALPLKLNKTNNPKEKIVDEKPMK